MSDEKKQVFKGEIFEIIQWEGKKGVTFERARRSPGVRLIIPTKDGKFLMSREYRTELDGWDYRLPGGKVFDSLDEYLSFIDGGGDIIEKAKEAAKREGSEESGIDIKELDYFATSVCGTTVNWDLIYFVVTDYEERESGQDLELGEKIEIVELGADEIEAKILDGSMSEERSAIMILRYIKGLNA